MGITIHQLSKHIGASVTGIDITVPINNKTFEALRQALYKHSVLIFHNQTITDKQQIAFSKGFGTLQMTMISDPYGGGGYINQISNVDENGEIIPPDDTRSLYQDGNMLWHSDGSFKQIPLKASFLSAKAVPPRGGETEYASLRAAYATLPKKKKNSLDALVAEHSMAYSRAQIAPNLITEKFLRETPPACQPLVRKVPETGEKILYVGSYASHIIGCDNQKGKALLQKLLEWSTQPQFIYQHKWQVNDLGGWDNRLCLHRGRPWEKGTYKRIMHRTTLSGDEPTINS